MIARMTAAPALDNPDGMTTSSARPSALWRRRGVRATVVAALVIAASALTLVIAYRPLQHVDGVVWAGQLTGGRAEFGYGAPARDLQNAFGSELVVGGMPNGGRVGLVIDLRNGSPLPVTVLGVEPFLLEESSRGTRLYVGAGDRDALSSLRPASTFTVPAHGYRTVGLAVDIPTDCKPGMSGNTITTREIRVRYRFGGIPRTTSIELNELAVSLDAPPVCFS